MRLIPILAIAMAALVLASNVQPILLRDIEALTFEAGAMVSRVRSPVQPAMQCKGGACHDSEVQPKRAACRKLGWDGQAVTWACDFPQLDDRVSISQFAVRCEGWSFAGDPHVRPGSCVLDYHIIYRQETPKSRPPTPIHPPPPRRDYERQPPPVYHPDAIHTLHTLFYSIMIVALIFLLLAVACSDAAPRHANYVAPEINPPTPYQEVPTAPPAAIPAPQYTSKPTPSAPLPSISEESSEDYQDADYYPRDQTVRRRRHNTVERITTTTTTIQAPPPIIVHAPPPVVVDQRPWVFPNSAPPIFITAPPPPPHVPRSESPRGTHNETVYGSATSD